MFEKLVDLNGRRYAMDVVPDNRDPKRIRAMLTLKDKPRLGEDITIYIPAMLDQAVETIDQLLVELKKVGVDTGELKL